MRGMWLYPSNPLLVLGRRYYAWRGRGRLDRARLWLAMRLLHSVETVVLEASYLEVSTVTASTEVSHALP